MPVNTTFELLEYYSGLLIKQYLGKPQATAQIRAFVRGFLMAQTSVQTITFPVAPASGTFTLIYDEEETANIAWNAGVGTVQTRLRALTGLSAITVSGTIATGLTVTFTGVIAPALMLAIGDNSTNVEDPIFGETDQTLPLAVLNGYNLVGDNIAVGVQLDVLGKYTGVTRTGVGIYGQPITLVDSDFIQLIRMAILTNNSGSSLDTIETNLNSFFPGQVIITDYRNMRLNYLLSSTIGSEDLLQMFVTEGLLPKPMGVQVSVAVVPDLTNLFSFRTYSFTIPNGTSFNRYPSYNQTWKWLSYADFI
jgi:hypothetical protein